MSYFRSYFEKNNTLLKDSRVNTSKNPTTEIFYGSGFSKFIFKVDLNKLKEKITNDELIINPNTKHTLHLTNTIFGDEGLKGLNRTTGRDRATSFKLIIFKITQYWDEGIGFDYQDLSYDFVDGNKTYDERPSNWYYRTTMNSWGTAGIYSTTPTIIGEQTFDNGNEDLNVDITTYVNQILEGGVNQGMGIAFDIVYQDLNVDRDQSVAFFTKYTQTFFEPYVESYFDDIIMDDRSNFVEKQNQNLYLYVTKGGNYYNLDNTPTVNISDSTKSSISGLTGLSSTLIKKGVYKVTFSIDNISCDGKKFFYDTWSDLSINGSDLSDVTQKFVPNPITNGFTIGENQTELERYSFQFFGVKFGEKIKRGDIRKITITMRSINTPKTVILDELYYRMYVLEGRTQVNVHDWTLVDKTNNENSFHFDTSCYIPREYHIELKGKTHTEEIHYKEPIKFEIVSEK
jgi:hypothetical protein